MNFTRNELLHRSMKLEGERFKLYKRLDKCRSIYEFPVLQKEIQDITLQIELYQKLILDMKKLSTPKRRENA